MLALPRSFNNISLNDFLNSTVLNYVLNQLSVICTPPVVAPSLIEILESVPILGYPFFTVNAMVSYDCLLSPRTTFMSFDLSNFQATVTSFFSLV